MNDFVEELRWRGMLHNIMPGTEEQLSKELSTAYVGIDPTADSLHIGRLVGVMMLRLQKKEITPETTRALNEITTFIGMLSDYYIKDKTEGLNFGEE